MLTCELKYDLSTKHVTLAKVYHRIGIPAVTDWYPNGQKACQHYFLHGKRHRMDGPAA